MFTSVVMWLHRQCVEACLATVKGCQKDEAPRWYFQSNRPTSPEVIGVCCSAVVQLHWYATWTSPTSHSLRVYVSVSVSSLPLQTWHIIEANRWSKVLKWWMKRVKPVIGPCKILALPAVLMFSTYSGHTCSLILVGNCGRIKYKLE